MPNQHFVTTTNMQAEYYIDVKYIDKIGLGHEVSDSFTNVYISKIPSYSRGSQQIPLEFFFVVLVRTF